MKMSYYHFNKKENLQKAKERYYKEEAADYYSKNKEEIKEKSKNWHKQERGKIKKYQRKRYQQLFQYEKAALQNK